MSNQLASHKICRSPAGAQSTPPSRRLMLINMHIVHLHMQRSTDPLLWHCALAHRRRSLVSVHTPRWRCANHPHPGRRFVNRLHEAERIWRAWRASAAGTTASAAGLSMEAQAAAAPRAVGPAITMPAAVPASAEPSGPSTRRRRSRGCGRRTAGRVAARRQAACAAARG